ncbi:hypothetical protein [Thiomicrorhabdus sp. 6S3-12]|uniref:hypothetical protein n=1 Tax=Thiomicrorhabdus sp. 6S3-12 TaxID=2819681 RepID=UPI001AAC6CE8|nr:hypothetical protein [Thiomicrorhabdus sp. 6S3-12]MBO1923865.1 hypothetical protein [Thiomicrorhabdus sp. 6S3-12]
MSIFYIKLGLVCLSHNSYSIAGGAAFISKSACDGQWFKLPGDVTIEDAEFEWNGGRYYFVADCTGKPDGERAGKILTKELAVKVSNTSFDKLMAIAIEALFNVQPDVFESKMALPSA